LYGFGVEKSKVKVTRSQSLTARQIFCLRPNSVKQSVICRYMSPTSYATSYVFMRRITHIDMR